MFKTIVKVVFFFKCPFSLSNECHSFSKLKRILTLKMIFFKAFENWKNSFSNAFEHICFKCVFDPKNYEF